MDIEGVSAVVTGASSGIGAAAARALAAEGARCVVADVNEQLGVQVAQEIGGTFVHSDVTQDDGLDAAVAAAEAMAPMRIAVNAAGILVGERTVDRAGKPHDLTSFVRVVTVNLIGVFNGTRVGAAAIARTDPIAPDGQRGVIVNLSSVASFDGQIGQAAYASSKAGIPGMTLPIPRDPPPTARPATTNAR